MNDWRAGFISSLAVQSDKRIVVGGLFSTVNGEKRDCLVRLLSDGTVDLSFEPSAGVSGMLGGDPEYPPRPYIGSISLQEDRKIVLTGLFTLVNGVPRTGFARLEANGALDETFQPSSNLSNIVAIAIQRDGKLIVAAPNLVRLNADGTYDSSFRQGPDREPITGVRALVLTAENKILIGGTFTNIDGFPRAYFARLNESGELDLTFLSNLTGPDDSVSSISTGRSGDVFVAGAFMRFNGGDRPSIARVFLEDSFSFGPEILLSNGQLQVNWSALQPGTYQLEYKTNLSQSTWMTFPTTLLSGGEPPEMSIDLRQFDATQCFFRMKFVP
jgi:uncharacterized delta-60 repeat protein